jgi:hypothetical protein
VVLFGRPHAGRRLLHQSLGGVGPPPRAGPTLPRKVRTSKHSRADRPIGELVCMWSHRCFWKVQYMRSSKTLGCKRLTLIDLMIEVVNWP